MRVILCVFAVYLAGEVISGSSTSSISFLHMYWRDLGRGARCGAWWGRGGAWWGVVCGVVGRDRTRWGVVERGGAW